MIDDVLICSAVAPETEDGSDRVFDPAWRTEIVVALSTLIVTGHEFYQMAILADELEEAGCNDGMVLRHCRECRRHKAGCWVLSLTLDRSDSSSAVSELSPESKQSLQKAILVKEKARAARPMTLFGCFTIFLFVAAISATAGFVKLLFIVAALK